MKEIAWSELPEDIQQRKILNWSELPRNLDLKTVPAGVTIEALTGGAREEAIRKLNDAMAQVRADVAASGMTEEEISEIINGD